MSKRCVCGDYAFNNYYQLFLLVHDKATYFWYCVLYRLCSFSEGYIIMVKAL